MKHLLILFAVLSLAQGCSSSKGGGGFKATGDLSSEETWGWIEIGATCRGRKVPAKNGLSVHTKEHPGNSFEDPWGRGRIGGYLQPLGGRRYNAEFIKDDRVKLHELGFHLVEIDGYNNYAEPANPFDICNTGRSMAARGKSYPVLVVGPDGEILSGEVQPETEEE